MTFAGLVHLAGVASLGLVLGWLSRQVGCRWPACLASGIAAAAALPSLQELPAAAAFGMTLALAYVLRSRFLGTGRGI